VRILKFWIVAECFTSSLQPLDVGINKTIKQEYKNLWLNWMTSSNKNWTATNKRHKPSYQDRVDMVSIALESINSKPLIKAAFQASGMLVESIKYRHGKELLADLNPHLQQIIHPNPLAITSEQAALLDLAWTLGKPVQQYVNSVEFNLTTKDLRKRAAAKKIKVHGGELGDMCRDLSLEIGPSGSKQFQLLYEI
jgi:hypothetical protein